jgi:hypothetical protein
LIQWRGTVSEEEIQRRAGYVVLEFANGRRSALHLNFGQQILLRSQLDFSFDRVRGRFYGGRPSAPDAIQRQRFTIPGKDRSVSRLWLEVPEDAPEGCLYLLAVSLGVPE